MKYNGILPERKTWVKVAAIVLAGYMLFLQLMARQWIYIPLVALVILACFFKKEHIISEKGVDIQYRLFRLELHNYWKWEEITTLHTDRKKAKPNVMLHIGKDIVTRTYIMKPADCQASLRLAAQKNPSIYIEDRSEAEQDKRAQEIRSRRASKSKRSK